MLNQHDGPHNGSRGNAGNTGKTPPQGDAERFFLFFITDAIHGLRYFTNGKFQHGRSGKPFQPGFHLMFGFRTHQGTALLPEQNPCRRGPKAFQEGFHLMNFIIGDFITPETVVQREDFLTLSGQPGNKFIRYGKGLQSGSTAAFFLPCDG